MATFLGVIKAVGTDSVKVGDAVVHIVEDIGVGAADAVKLLTTAKTLTPEVKEGFATLVSDGEALATAFLSAGSDPANLVADSAAVADLVKLVKDVVAFLPVLKSAVAALEADVQ